MTIYDLMYVFATLALYKVVNNTMWASVLTCINKLNIILPKLGFCSNDTRLGMMCAIYYILAPKYHTHLLAYHMIPSLCEVVWKQLTLLVGHMGPKLGKILGYLLLRYFCLNHGQSNEFVEENSALNIYIFNFYHIRIISCPIFCNWVSHDQN